MRRVLPVPAEVAFTLIGDLAGHDRWIPLTTIDAPPAPPRPGDVMEAVTTGFFVDRMRVEEVRAPEGGRPGLLRVRKIGPVLLGDVSIEVEPLGPGRCAVDWGEQVHLRGPLPRRFTTALLTPVLEGMTALALWRIERYLTR
ncbi:SRPBCC family protein [Georgenia muralis]